MTRTIRARPARVYTAIADYAEEHPHIVPGEYFPRLEVLEGGFGAGTRTRVAMTVLNRTRVFEQVVTEPVTIATDLPARPGIPGFLERTCVSLMLARIDRKELARLAEHVARHRPGEPGRPAVIRTGTR